MDTKQIDDGQETRNNRGADAPLELLFFTET